MKKLFLFLSAVILSFAAFSAEPTQQQKQAVFMMNYSQYVTYKLKTYNNILALEEEYKNLKDNMNFQTIQDYDSVDEINNLMDAIHNERKNHKNRERLEQSVQRRMNDALFNSIPKVTTIVSGGVNPLSAAINSAYSLGGIFVSYQQYKNKLSEEYDEKMFEYQFLTEDILNDKYKNLNTYTWNLIQKYGISDEWRLNETELSQFFMYLKDSDTHRAYTNLKNMSSDRYVQHFPMFWYHLANLAYKDGEEAEALKYYTRFEAENIEIFRYDTTAVDAYKGKISILLKNQEANKKEILSKLAFIEKNKTSWNDYYFCALVYAQLQDKQNAKRLLERNINELSSKVEAQFLQGSYLDKILNERAKTEQNGIFGIMNNTFNNEESSTLEVAGSTDYDGLELCRALLKELDDNKISVASIENQYKSDTQSVNEILYWFGLNPASSVLRNSKEDIKKVLVSSKVLSEKACQIDVKIPLQWVMSANTDLDAVFYKPNSEKPVILRLKIDEKETKKLKKAKSTPKDTILCYTTGKADFNWKKEGYYFAGIYLAHAIYPVQFLYSIDLNKPVKNVAPCGIYFNGREYGL